jgi:hypothetical protein
LVFLIHTELRCTVNHTSDHCSSPLNAVSKNVSTCELRFTFVTKTRTATMLSCLGAVSHNCVAWLYDSSYMSVLPSAWNSYAPTGRIFTKFDLWYIFFFGNNLSSEIRFQSNLTRIAGTLYEDLCTCMRTPRWMLLKVSHTKVEEKNQNTHFMFGNSFFENRAVNEIMWQEYWRAGQAKWQYNTAHAHYMKDNKCYKHTIRICNNYYYC